jgi:hypothetical protein
LIFTSVVDEIGISRLFVALVDHSIISNQQGQKETMEMLRAGKVLLFKFSIFPDKLS